VNIQPRGLYCITRTMLLPAQHSLLILDSLSSGGYWSLDKRAQDVGSMSSEWRQWCKTMGPFHARFSRSMSVSVATLGERLAQCASLLDEGIMRERGAIGETLLHGDFKTANLFFHSSGGCEHRVQPAVDASGHAEAAVSSNLAGDPAAESNSSAQLDVGVCDFQWCGYGLPMADVQYLLWTSVDPAVVQTHTDSLTSYYIAALRSKLKALGHSCVPSQTQLEAQSHVRRHSIFCPPPRLPHCVRPLLICVRIVQVLKAILCQ
jgi:Ecdysteroid kinase-like family